MKKIFAGLLFILTLCLLGTALAFHDHVDLDGAPTLPSGYRAPTETEDGYSGDEVCSVCGEVIEKGNRIPSLEEQRRIAEGNKPSASPSSPAQSSPSPVPTAIPTPTPTAPPTITPTPAASEAPAGTSDGTPVPPPVSSPTPTAPPTPVPTAVSPGASGGGDSAAPTAQPDLLREAELMAQQAAVSQQASGGGSSGGSASGSRKKSVSTKTSAKSSSRFPWRRMLMQPASGIVLPLAGELVWPVSDSSSPLMMLMIPGR